jgi:hypothetical protein
MKAIGEKCGWVISSKERRVLKLLRTYARECDQEFVDKCPSVVRRRVAIKIQVEFANEDRSAFQPAVQFQYNSKPISPDEDAPQTLGKRAD